MSHDERVCVTLTFWVYWRFGEGNEVVVVDVVVATMNLSKFSNLNYKTLEKICICNTGVECDNCATCCQSQHNNRLFLLLVT